MILRLLKWSPLSVKNKQFSRLFVKNLFLIFSSVVLPLAVGLAVFYGISHQLLNAETDKANDRALLATKATLDTIILDTDTMLTGYSVKADIKQFFTLERAPNYDFFSLVNAIVTETKSKNRLYLDYGTYLYSARNDYLISSLGGGQTLSLATSESIVRVFREYTRKNPEENVFIAFLSESKEEAEGGGDNSENDSEEKEELSLANSQIAFFRKMPYSYNGRDSFIAICLNNSKLTQYLLDSTDDGQGEILIVSGNGILLYGSHEITRINHQIKTQLTQDAGFQGSEALGKGSLNLRIENDHFRTYWMTSQKYNLKFIRIIPYDEYIDGMGLLKKVLLLVILVGFFVSIAIAYKTSRRMFRPLEDILKIVENPGKIEEMDTRKSGIHFLLINILESFQKNIILEEEMLNRKSLLSNARAKALQEQINPHFLNNSLQTIHWLAVMETKSETSKTGNALVILSELVRACMEESGNLVTIREETEYIKKFMEMERLRFGEGLCCHCTAEEAVLDCKMLQLTLQPLVENSITHGIRPKCGEGNIYVVIRSTGNAFISVSVEDDGIGLSEEELRHFNYKYNNTEFIYANEHVGLVNLSQRIKLVYGEEYNLRFERSVYGGLKVETVLPKT